MRRRFRTAVMLLAALSVVGGLLATSAAGATRRRRTTTTTAATTTTKATSTTTSTTTTTAPAGSSSSCSGVKVYPGTNLQSAFDSNAAGTTFCFSPGTYVVSTHLVPKSNDSLIGMPSRAAVLTGQDQYDGGIAGSGGSGGQHDVLVQGLVIQHFVNPWTSMPRAAISAGTNWTIRDNEIDYNSQAGVHVSDGTQLLGNYIHDNGRYGFEGGPVSSLTVDGNEIARNNSSHYDPNDDAGGDKIYGASDGSKNIVVSNNYAHDNDGNGLWCDGNCLSAQFIGNRVVNNTYAGIYYETGFGPALIANNTMIGNCTASAGLSVWHCAEIWLNDSQNVEIRNNTGTATTNAIAGTDQNRGSTPFGIRMICNVTVHDNTIALGANGANGLATNWTNPCPTTPWNSY